MADFSQIIQEINTNLPNNTTQAITAAKLRDTLVDLTNTIDTVQDDFESNVNESIDEISNSVSSKQDANVTTYNYTPITYSSEMAAWIAVNGFRTNGNLYVRIFPVTQGSTYKIKGGFATGASSYMYAYLNGDTFLQAYDSAVGQTSTTKEYDITVPIEGTITHIAIQGGTSNQAACSLKEVSETINITNQVIANRDDAAELNVKLQGITATETKVTQQPVTGAYVKGSDGSIASSVNTAYLEIALGETKRVRFLGGWYTSSSYTSGYAFGHYSDTSTWVTDKSSVFDTDASTLGTKEYIVAVPEGATHFRTTTATGSLPALAQYFYCYLQTGERVVDIIGELEGELVETVEYPQTWTTLGGKFAFTVGQAPTITSTSIYRRIWVQNLKVGDIITVRARSGTSAQTGAKTKNGVVVSILSDNPTGTETSVAIRTYVVDDTFDGIAFNNYLGYVHNPNYFCTLTRNENSIDLINGEIEDLQEEINTIIEQGVGKEYNILCFGNSFTQDTISYVPFLLREAEPNYKFNFYFTYMGGMPISQCRAYVGGDGTESIVYNATGGVTGKYVNHGGYDTIYNYTNGQWVVETSHKSYTLYKLAWDANSWTSQSEPTIETVLGIIGDKKWDLITIQQGGAINYKTWDWYYKPYVYDIYATLKNRLNYNFKIGYLMTHGAYATTAEDLLSHYNGIVTNTTKIMENTPTEVLLPYATALQNARTTYLTRFGSYIMDGAKVKNGFVVETFKKSGSSINITCDGTFDAVILNNNNETVSSPTCTLNGITQTWTDGVMYGGLYEYCKPIQRTSSTYKSIYLTNLTEGDVIVSTNDSEDAGVCLLTDTAHVADGIGCLTCSYANALSILDMIGSSKSIVGSQIVPNAEWITEHNIPAASRVYGLSKYNIWLAQQCAVMAKKYPLQITDMVAKGMCKEIEIEMNDAVSSTNPIMSANNSESWTTTLVVPNGMVIGNVSVIMGTTDITADVYTESTNTVSIPNVSAKVTITVTTIPV